MTAPTPEKPSTVDPVVPPTAEPGLQDLIGNTPMVRLQRLRAASGGQVYAKLEYTNPGGSIKDRTALGLLRAAEEDGRLVPGGTVIEPTAGNTGIGLALVGVSRGYRVILVVPDKYSREKMMLMQALGGELELTPGADGMQRAIERAFSLAETLPDATVPQQFANPANPRIHYQTTGPELWQQMEGSVDAVVIGVGTGGTFTGVSRYIKERNPRCLAVAVEPQGSILGGGEAGEHKVEGIGVSFLPETLDMELIDEVITVSDEDAFA
ncbi:MAG: PLP-dependent cysteine synthase family protein, partial [Acidobacteriota bacterium]